MGRRCFGSICPALRARQITLSMTGLSSSPGMTVLSKLPGAEASCQSFAYSLIRSFAHASLAFQPFQNPRS